MRFKRKTKKEKIEEEIKGELAKLYSLKPGAIDLYSYIGLFSHERIKKFILNLFLRHASADDLCCLILHRPKYRDRAWKILASKLKPDAHSKVILLHIASEEPNLAVSAFTEIDRLGICLNFEEVSHLLGLKHIRDSDSICAKLQSLQKEERKRTQRIEAVFDNLDSLDKKIKELL